MPNWCYNDISIFSVTTDQHQALAAAGEAEEFLRPLTAEDDAGAPKWDVRNFELTGVDETNFHAGFETAWGPMSEGQMAMLSKQLPGALLQLTYREDGVGFYGATVAKDGVALDEEGDTEELIAAIVTEIFPDYDPTTRLVDFLNEDSEENRRMNFVEALGDAIEEATENLLEKLTAQLNGGQDQ
jgi:disulfide oxidoreductase YuzD